MHSLRIRRGHSAFVSIILVACLGGAGTCLGQARPLSAAPNTASSPVRFLVVADHESPLSAVSGGRVSHVYARLGDSVRVGEVLATLDCDDLKAKRSSAGAEHRAAQLRYEAKAKLQGLQSAAALEVELAAADVNRTLSQVRIFDAELAQCRFVAPFNGRVARVYVKEGQGVAPGTPIMDLVGTGMPTARLNVPSNWISWLKTGSRLAAMVDETGTEYILTVSRISGRVDAVSQTIEIEADFEGDTQKVLPGMSGRAWQAAPKKQG